MPHAAHFEPRALYSLGLLSAPLDAARRSLRAGGALCSLELLSDPWTPRAASFEPCALCSHKLLGEP